MNRNSSRPQRVFGTIAPLVSALWMIPVLSGCKPEVRAIDYHTNSVGMAMVRLDSGYYVSKFETRQSEFVKVMGVNPSMHRGPSLPVENMASSAAKQFCVKLTEMERAAGRLPKGYAYSLPTFAQWLEYTADADLRGSITPLGTPGKEYDAPLPVGSGEVNRLGLYDLRGNVSEFSKDLYRNGSNLLLGAHWSTHSTDFLKINNRAALSGSGRSSAGVGFRCVLVPQENSVHSAPKAP